MGGLFSSTNGEPERIPLPDAELLYFGQALSAVEADGYFRFLRTQTQWREEEVMIWGKRHMQPRLIAWHGDPDATYSYSGSVLRPSPWTTVLLELRARVEELSHKTFNSVLLNLYRGERDNMGWHSDDEPELGPEPTIASLSLGETREFQLKHKIRKDLPLSRISLTNGSVLVMSGTTQRYWQHCLKRETAKLGERINLTFRRISPETA
jgi:alkylated DNA repair dioxygenase AlkB